MVGTATEELLSLTEAADRLGVSVYTVRRWIKTGRLRAFRPGKEYRIQESDLEEFLRTREVRPKLQGPPSDPGQRSFENHLRDEQYGEWGAAVRSARQLRERGRVRTEELLALWRESKDREEDPAERRAYLDEIGELLQAAYDARPTLLQAMSYQSFADQWPEVVKADRFYVELWHLVRQAGLRIRTGASEDAEEEKGIPERRPEAVEEPRKAA